MTSIDWTQMKTAEQIETEQLEQESERARNQRDRLLKESDWTQVPDAPVDQTVWAEYRQTLRDVPSQSGFPTNIEWPTQPEERT